MPKLNIGFLKHSLDHGGIEASAIDAGMVARVRRLKDGSGEEVFESEREEIIPVGMKTHDVDVEPGLYHIELLLPSGAHLIKQRRVEGSDLDVIFETGGSPHEWMSWQHLEGAVPSGGEYYGQMMNLKGVAKSPRGIAPGSTLLRRMSSPKFGGTDNAAISASLSARDVDALPVETVVPGEGAATSALVLLRQSGPSPAGPAAWAQLAEALEGRRPRTDFRAGVAPGPSTSVHRLDHDDWYDSWRLSGDEARGDQRIFAIVTTARSAELVCLPLPWEHAGDANLVELLVDTSDASRPCRTNVTILDHRFAGLFAYFKQGSFALAKSVLERSLWLEFEEVLAEKGRNPLAAAAASYCLLASTDLSQQQDWFPWVERLGDRFAWIPDGKVLAARLQGSCEGACARNVRKLYLEAFERGLPFFALGLTWLRDGLRLFPDKQCRDAAALVRRVSTRVDTAQAFTVLHYD